MVSKLTTIQKSLIVFMNNPYDELPVRGAFGYRKDKFVKVYVYFDGTVNSFNGASHLASKSLPEGFYAIWSNKDFPVYKYQKINTRTISSLIRKGVVVEKSKNIFVLSEGIRKQK